MRLLTKTTRCPGSNTEQKGTEKQWLHRQLVIAHIEHGCSMCLYKCDLRVPRPTKSPYKHFHICISGGIWLKDRCHKTKKCQKKSCLIYPFYQCDDHKTALGTAPIDPDHWIHKVKRTNPGR